MTTSSRDIQRELEQQIRKDAEMRLNSKKAAEEIRDEVRAETPVDTGKAAASIHVEARKDHRGMPAWRVISRLWYFRFIENGTEADNPESKSRYGPNTPTPEFAPFAKVAHRHGGTTDGIEVDG
ncbi:HK97-gp10 family putative phage morphogenesis protein [Mycolicibacterium fortuitum]|uniref:HK97 gp10 family phage protein n=1 Tax=Mycolicibacterium fortuitum TaxID=1766 RepID=A0AAE4V6Q7_MYCFO|nr:HK97-gp10 family putative phage morphogenesis protein [Mycolicibacterium fortuitum]MDV7194609.1 HK97 gp10 family phage protein [Mycolicibacterium fortuitum]MDV7208609.1 HK97 gp10 family phage protein [Mycolicibacterium fortuitum]MDV7230506.1 HK97 gp10 family phage protein [Mycolicibacterium fortuitum]MDV7261887.1 HK97 gp10 family phage protein [Mycolicibacterium fortuitum]MDV7287004.1 HK97 gp10 family phage protein [Mycolicibacterium fortuitum]